MRISVVIPARNEASIIDACLKALAAQTLSPYEIIIVDNNSTDDTAQRAAHYGHVRIVTEKRIGISIARNTGFDSATGDIIARCDVDTHVSANWIYEITQFFEQHPAVAAITGPATYYDAPRIIRRLLNWLFLDMFYLITRRNTGGETLFGSNCAVRQETWLKVRADVCTDDLNMHEDIDLGQHIQQVGTIAFNEAMQVSISARPLLHPMGMIRRWRKGLNNFHRH